MSEVKITSLSSTSTLKTVVCYQITKASETYCAASTDVYVRKPLRVRIEQPLKWSYSSRILNAFRWFNYWNYFYVLYFIRQLITFSSLCCVEQVKKKIVISKLLLVEGLCDQTRNFPLTTLKTFAFCFLLMFFSRHKDYSAKFTLKLRQTRKILYQLDFFLSNSMINQKHTTGFASTNFIIWILKF